MDSAMVRMAAGMGESRAAGLRANLDSAMVRMAAGMGESRAAGLRASVAADSAMVARMARMWMLGGEERQLTDEIERN